MKNPERFVRSFLTLHRTGVLSSASQRYPGYPHGSVVPYDITPEGNFVIFISRISEHFHNLTRESRSSIFVPDFRGLERPQSYGRVSVLTDFHEVSENVEDVERSYRNRFPKSSAYSMAHNFVYFLGVPKGIRWIAGFGSMGWMSPVDYSATSPDALAYTALDAISHMNEDHRDALVDFVRSLGSDDAKTLLNGGVVRMTWLSESGFEIIVEQEGRTETVQIPFDPPVKDPRDVRKTIVSLLKKVRSGLLE